MGVLITIRRLMGDRTPMPEDVTPPDASELAQEDEFVRVVRDSLDELPEDVLATLEHIPVLVADDGAAVGAYGMYHGAGMAHPDVPAHILVYRDTLTRDFGDDPERLAAEIRRTVRHELAHHLGYGESGVRTLGL